MTDSWAVERKRPFGAVLVVAVVLVIGLVVAAATALLGPQRAVICGEGHILDRSAQAIMRPLGGGHIEGPSATRCVVPSTPTWLLAVGVFLVFLAVAAVVAIRRASSRSV